MTTKKLEPTQISRACWLLAYGLCAWLNVHIFYVGLQDFVYDECGYIASGRQLILKQLPSFAMNPFISGIFAALYVPYIHSPYWMVHMARTANVLIFTLIWYAAYRTSRRVVGPWSSLIAAAMLVGIPFFPSLMANSSDALFTGLAGLALSFVLDYAEQRTTLSLFFCSTTLGFAAMTRSDGLLIMATFLVIVLILEIRFGKVRLDSESKLSTLRLTKIIVAALVPFVVLVGGYLGLTKIVTGDVQWGLEERTYEAFQQGEGIAYCNYLHHGNWQPYDLGSSMADAKYGTQESNHSSVLRAIQRNPRGYADRFLHAIKYLPGSILQFINGTNWTYGYAALLISSSLLGMFTLIHRQKVDLYLIFLLWHVHLLIYFITFFRSGYFMLTLVTLVTLAGVGLRNLLDRIYAADLFVIAAVYLSMTIGAYALYMPELGRGLVIFSFPLALPILQGLNLVDVSRRWLAGMQAVAIGGCCLLAHRPLDLSPLPGAKDSDEAAASYFIQRHGESGGVAGYDPGAAEMAKRFYLDLGDASPFGNAATFKEWAINNTVSEIVLDPGYQGDYPADYALIQAEIGKMYNLAFETTDGSYEVLSLKR